MLEINFVPLQCEISDEDYHKSHGISRSSLMEFKRSPYHYRYKYIDNDYSRDEETPAMIFGKALHTMILEPEKLLENFYVVPKLDKRTKIGASKWEEVKTEMGSKKPITESQYSDLQEMKKSFQKNSLACEIIQCAKVEQSIYWKDEETDVLCKCRPDILLNSMVCDFKTAQDGSPSFFSKAIMEYGYHIQMAMIREALRNFKKIEITDFWFIVIEKVPPYIVSMYKLDSASVDKGQEEFKKLINKYRYCLDNNYWPAYIVQEISLPNYAFKGECYGI